MRISDWSSDVCSSDLLFERQHEVLQGRACDEFLAAQQAMGMSAQQIPRFSDINQVLADTTGWQLIGVEGLLPELTFFERLANRRFPVTWWIRRPDQLDFIAEPDLFHEIGRASCRERVCQDV